MKILVVDDESTVREVIAEILEQAGYEVTTAATARSALARFSEGGIDMITLDHAMPGMTGSELHEAIAQQFSADRPTSGFVKRSLPPILMVTASPDEEDVMRTAFGDGVIGVLPKPFTAQALLDVVGGTLGPPGQ